MAISDVFIRVKQFSGSIFFGALVCLLAGSCTPEKVWVSETQNTWYQLEEQQYNGDFVLENVQVNPAARRYFMGGVGLKFSFGLSAFNRLLLRDETDLGYDSYRLTAQLFRANGQPLSQVKEINGGRVLPAQISQELVFRIGAYSPPEFFFPFRDFSLAQGNQQIIMEVKGYAQAPGKKPQAEPSLTLRVAAGFVQPKLFSAQIGVDYFELNTDKADPHSFDFRMAGSGFPDLCWRLLSGSEVMHTSAVAKNKTVFSSEEKTPEFVISETDSIRLQFYDDDELSDHDILATWLGSPVSLPRPTSQEIPFPSLTKGQMQNAKVWAKIKPLEIDAE